MLYTTFNKKKTGAMEHRRELILEILQENEIKKEIELLNELEDRGVKASQPTINRDLSELGIVKDDFGVFQPNAIDKKNKHKHELQLLINSSQTAYYPKVKIIFIKTGPGTSQAIAYHLENIFEKIVLKTTIDNNSITLLVNADTFNDNEEFQQFLNSINEKKK
ncbi:hypothetical protein [Lysinibacillus sphaericus]|uniref:hypothetical protein n=1 Tax=Lysinibacillus sphaericus TaxID=1421 RepID=UPI001CBED65D|nr:hypothetical protein [Lysinibacillus sphaericus]